VHLDLNVQTTTREQFINITGQLNELLAESGVKDGCCTVFVSHTTAALTVNEDADPAVMEDMLSFLHQMVPLNNSYHHREGNSDAHIKASLLGCSLHLIIKDGYFDLGTWQGVFLAEFDGPRPRSVKVWIA
jgi:secondary thiamine-phosphate synthase enzyme